MTLRKTSPGVYDVIADGRVLGTVERRAILSYRGTQGWNRGVRIKDYHPAAWVVVGDGVHHRTRREAVEAIVSTSNLTFPAPIRYLSPLTKTSRVHLTRGS